MRGVGYLVLVRHERLNALYEAEPRSVVKAFPICATEG